MHAANDYWRDAEIVSASYRANIWLPLVLEPDNARRSQSLFVWRRSSARGVTPAKPRKRWTLVHRDQSQRSNPRTRAHYMPPLHESFVMDLRPKILVIVVRRSAHLDRGDEFSRLLLARVIEAKGFALRAAWARADDNSLATARPGASPGHDRNRTRSARRVVDDADTFRA